MLVEPFIDAVGDKAERERVTYDLGILYNDGPPMIGLLRRHDGDDLSCLQGVHFFGLRLKAGTTREEAQALRADLVRLQVSFEAIYKPPPDGGGPTFPNVSDGKVVTLQRAA